MGSTAQEVERALEVASGTSPRNTNWQKHIKSEWPKHTTLLTEAFYIGVTEITQEEYIKVVESDASKHQAHASKIVNGSEANSSQYPAAFISWYDAVRFCGKLNALEKYDFSPATLSQKGYRLPTEAQWEYSCRAGTTMDFWVANEAITSAGWFAGNSSYRLNPVGKLRANPCGLHDTHANVWEWVWDSWDPTYYGTSAELILLNPAGSSKSGLTHVLRGGGWSSHALGCRAASRHASYRI